jgi:hypothetical protein
MQNSSVKIEKSELSKRKMEDINAMLFLLFRIREKTKPENSKIKLAMELQFKKLY